MFRDQPPQKILIINIFGIGDVLFTTPLISNLKAAFPELKIGYMCNSRSAPVVRNHPHIDRVHIYDRDAFATLARKSRWAYWRQWQTFRREIQHEKYDAVIDLSLTTFPGLLCWFSGIRRRIGLNYRNRSRFLNHKIPLEAFSCKHVVEYYLDILSHLDVPVIHRRMQMTLTSGEMVWAQEFLKRKGLKPAQRLMGIVPGGGASWGKDSRFKRWGPGNYAKIADKLIEKYSVQIILFGDPGETPLCQEVAAQMRHPAILASGETDLGQFAALARCCELMMVNDGGPLHIAVAAGARTISIFGPVDERVYGPYPPEGHRVIKKGLSCQPCYQQFRRSDCDHISCLNDLDIESVFQHIEDFINEYSTTKETAS